jgi:hypothetical protein
MTINIIDKKMIVQNKIELHPTINYVSASSDCNFLQDLDVNEAGVYGFVSTSNTNITKNRVYNVNNTFINNQKNTLERLEETKTLKSNLKQNLTNVYGSDSLGDSLLENVVITGTCARNGIQLNTTEKHQFNVERIKKEYLIDSQSYKKKLTVFNLYEYYRENIEHDNFHDLSWGFKNYNSLNFFSIDDKVNANFSKSLTHKTCLIYPNLISGTKNVYDFGDTKDFTVSFYINPKRKNITGYHYNPGCIINIPGVISIFLVKGTSIDENGLTDKFRILTQFGEKTYTELSSTTSNFDFSNSSTQNVGLNYLSKDNVLLHNNWHNVLLSYRKSEVGNSKSYLFEIFVDGNLIDSLYYPVELETQSSNSFIMIGNKSLVLKQDLSDFVLKAFSKDKSVINDNLGPYVKKHILFGNQINSVLNGVSDPSKSYDFKNIYNADNADYITQNTSHALNAELCDIRIYNQGVTKEKALLICKNGINNISTEISSFGLMFYVPVYFRSQNVKRKGLVSLSAPYKKYIVGEGIATGIVDNYLAGNYLIDGTVTSLIDTEPDFQIKTENISYNYPINPFFLSYTGGTEVSVEHFTREFVINTQPNVVIGGNISEDFYQNCFLSNSDFILNNDDFNKKIKEGGTPNDLLDSIYKEFNGATLTNIKNNVGIDHQVDSIIHKNYLVLPNDNGIQRQYYNNEVFNYNIENDYLDIHKDDLNEINYSFVSLKNINKDFHIKSNVSLRHLYTDDYNFFIDNPEYDRRNFFITNNTVSQGINNRSKRFDENYDKLRNISLNNYHSQYKLSYLHLYDSNMINSCTWRKENIDVQGIYEFIFDKNNFYKTFSNPAQRSYYASFDDSVSTVLTYDEKNISQDNNIIYKKMYTPLWQTDIDFNENSSTIFCISNQIFNKKIKRETFEIKDVDMPLSSGVKLTFKDSNLGTMYRCDSLTESARWNTSGNILYNEGVCTLLHPSLYNFGKTNFKITSKSHSTLNVFELNLPSHAGESNLSKNKSYIKDLRLDQSAFNSDEDFVYITDIDIHDENLNVVAKAKLAQPFPKKNSDNVLFRVKMDF